MTSYWQKKSHDLGETDKLLAQYSQGFGENDKLMSQKFASLSDSDELLAQKPPGRIEIDVLLAKKSKVLKSQGESENDALQLQGLSKIDE